jgi:riboflavin kinase/FMN adenylyltransferase
MPDVKVSSSIIRKLVAAGDILTANSLLGRPFRLSGIVVHGKGIGKSLGFPTANLSLVQPDLLLPADGVYEAVVNGERQALVNIGCNPTMDATQRTIEVHIPLFEGNLYNTLLTIDFIRKIRDEKKFSSLLELQQQIHRDLLSLQK